MGNSLKIDLTGKHVLIKAEVLKEEFNDIPKRVFKVQGGFGAKPYTIGTALIGTFLFDGESTRESTRMDGYMAERLATQEEIDDANEFYRENQ